VEWDSHLEPKSGKTYSNNGAFVIDCADGRIQWVREYFDTQKSNENVN
jgi:ketosteroid isomerase-like protein